MVIGLACAIVTLTLLVLLIAARPRRRSLPTPNGPVFIAPAEYGGLGVTVVEEGVVLVHDPDADAATVAAAAAAIRHARRRAGVSP